MLFINNQARHRIDRVLSVGLVGDWIDHFLTVTMICRNYHGIVASNCCIRRVECCITGSIFGHIPRGARFFNAMRK